jgi:membrane protein involved in colicin uptake
MATKPNATSVSDPDAPALAPDPSADRVTSRHAVENAAAESLAAEQAASAQARADAQVADDKKALAAAAAAAKAAATPEKVDKGGVLLRYLGSSDVFEDADTGLRFVAGGTPHDVPEDVALRLERQTGRYEQFERVSAGD